MNRREYSGEGVAEHMYGWFTREGPLKGVGQLGPNTPMDLDHSGPMLRVRWGDISQILEFQSPSRKGDWGRVDVLNASDVNPTVDQASEFITSLSSRFDALTSSQVAAYKSIFGRPVVGVGDVEYEPPIPEGVQVRMPDTEFRKVRYDGVHVNLPIRELPLGSGKKLSPKLFTYLFNTVIKPSKAVMLGLKNDPTTDKWK